MNDHINIVRIKAVHQALDELKDKVVFIGGATVSLYADRTTYEIRPTDDVDILIELYKRHDYFELEEQLRKKGFENDAAAGFAGRYKINGITVDVMPTIEEILGFSNMWYAAGYSNAIDFTIDDQSTVKIFTAPYFIASKLEAFKTRGRDDDGDIDGRFSRDFEDIIFVLENRSSIWDEMNNAENGLRSYLRNEWKALLANPFLEEWIEGYAAYGSPPATYYILDELRKFVEES